MVPARNLLRRHCDTFGGAFSFIDAGEDDGDISGGALFNDISISKSRRSSGKYASILNTAYYDMAEKTTVRPGAEEGEEGDEEEEEEEAAGTSSGGSKNWLQLGLGTPASTSGTTRGHLMELELFTDRSSTSASASTNLDAGVRIAPPPMATMPATVLRPSPHGLSYYRQDMPLPWGAAWNERPNFMSGAATNSMPLSPSPSHPLGMPDFLARQFMFPLPPSQPSAAVVVDRASSMRVIKPPPRPQSGVWFFLQAALQQGREPFLPQISRSYLRIKDGRMTVSLLMKYLVKKLALEDESQVEITCRGQLLLPSLTLQHVRDNIWSCSRESMALLGDSPSMDHVMTLQYSRSI